MRFLLRWLRRAVMAIGVVAILVVVLALTFSPKNDESQNSEQPSRTQAATEQPSSASRPLEPAAQAALPSPGPELPAEPGSGAVKEKRNAVADSRSSATREAESPEAGADRVAGSTALVAAFTSDAVLGCPEPARVQLDYDEPVPVRTIAADIVEQWGLRAAGLDIVPSDTSRKFFWTLTTASALSVLSRDAEWTWYRDGDAVRFVRRDDPVLRTDGVVPTEFAVAAERAEGGLLVSVVSDLDRRREVTVTVDRVFAAQGGDNERSWQYLRQCGLASQWRSPKLLALDDAAWADGLQANQDSMARLGPDVAFDLEAPSERVRVTARYRGHEAQTAVLAPLSVPLRTGPSAEVGAQYLELRESYRLRSEVRLTGLLTDPGSRATRLGVGDVIRVLAAERSGFSPDYLVEAGGRRGWISSIALMPEGATRVSGSSEADRRTISIFQALWDRVWQPCADFAYNLVAATRGDAAVGSTAKMRVVELMLPWLDDVAVELEDAGVDTLSESETSALYRDLRMQCRSGAVRDRG